eukprot:1050548-Amorphochlora_amoeboformis.AAC.1
MKSLASSSGLKEWRHWILLYWYPTTRSLDQSNPNPPPRVLNLKCLFSPPPFLSILFLQSRAKYLPPVSRKYLYLHDS